jgi:peptide/nickel transport system permease protein
MLSYLARRLGYALIMVILISFVSFIIIQLPPGDYLTHKLAELQVRGDRSALDRIEEYRARYGLDEPFLSQYWNWVSHFITGDFGESFRYERPVADLLGERLAMTAVLAIATLAVTWLIAIPIGVYSATHQYSLGDQIFTTISFIGLGTPSFVLALVVLFIAIVILDQDVVGLFSREYQDAPWNLGKVVDLLKHLWVPALIGAFTGTAGLIRIMRGNLLDELRKPYVTTARAKGLAETRLLTKYPVRIAINPLISTIGWTLPQLFSGSTLVAIVLNLQTVGPVLFHALLSQDMYVAGSILLILSALTVIGTLISDILLAWVDPRIRLGGG